MVQSCLLTNRWARRFFFLVFFIDCLELISEIIVLEIRFIFPVPLFTLSPMKFFATGRTARSLSLFLLSNGLKPLPANTAGTFSTYIFCHSKISSVQNQTKIYAKSNVKKGGGYWRDSGVFFLLLAGYGGGVN
ncbi:MAG: hypothetical protein R6V15_13035 [Desulfotignum sp.]|jgi:hypothetical protein